MRTLHFTILGGVLECADQVRSAVVPVLLVLGAHFRGLGGTPRKSQSVCGFVRAAVGQGDTLSRMSAEPSKLRRKNVRSVRAECSAVSRSRNKTQRRVEHTALRILDARYHKRNASLDTKRERERLVRELCPRLNLCERGTNQELVERHAFVSLLLFLGLIVTGGLRKRRRDLGCRAGRGRRRGAGSSRSRSGRLWRRSTQTDARLLHSQHLQ